LELEYLKTLSFVHYHKGGAYCLVGATSISGKVNMVADMPEDFGLYWVPPSITGIIQ
jgi:hypothetical protein